MLLMRQRVLHCLSLLLMLSGDVETNPGPESGTNTREYKTIEKYIPQLEDQICDDIRNIAHFLLRNGYISKKVHSSVTDPDSKYSRDEKAGVLVKAVLRKVELVSGNYQKFVDRLREDVYYQDMVTLLDEEYGRLEASEDVAPPHIPHQDTSTGAGEVAGSERTGAHNTQGRKRPTEANLKGFVIHLNSCTPEELDMTKDHVCSKFPELPPNSKKESLMITWSLTAKIASSLRQKIEITDNIEFFQKHNIKSVTIDRKECKYSPVKRYAAYLKDHIYSHMEDKNISPFKLVRIRKVKIHERNTDFFTRSTLRGDQDDVVYEKEHMKENELCHKHWKDDKEPRLVLIEGAPGVGKTTFSKQCCYKWSHSQSLHDHTLLVLLPLRDKGVRSAKNLRDLFQHTQLGQIIAEVVEGSGGEGITLWLEAWDELEKDKGEKSSVFLDLVHGRLLSKAKIIVTSRPWATKDMRESPNIKIDQHVEVVSTPKIQFSRLLRDEQKVGADSRDKFIDYVTFNPAIKAALHTPITADIVAEVFQWSRDTESSPPATVTQLYTAFTCKLLMQHLSSHKAQGKQSPKIISLEKLPSSIEREFENMCRLAWEGILEQKLTFGSGAIGGETLGLMCGVKELYGRELSYHFIHLTLQEFLSAYHIAQLPQDEQEQVIRGHLTVGHLNQMVIFYFGLSRLDTFISTTISEHISYEQRDNPAPYVWMMECQVKEAVSNVLRPGKRVAVSSSYAWSPLDFFSLGYCIAHSQSCQWTLHFPVSMGVEGMEYFCKGLSLRATTFKGEILGANFALNALAIEGIQWLGKVPHQILKQIKGLDLTGNHLDRNALDHFSQIIPKLTNLQELSLNNNYSIGAGGAVELLRTLCLYKTPLRKLELVYANISEEDCAHLSSLLTNIDMETLDISHQQLSNSVAYIHTIVSEKDCAHLHPILTNIDMETLDISHNQLSNSVAYIMEGLYHKNTLQTLRMHCSQLSEENCTSLASVLQQSVCQLKLLDISWCSITSEGAKQLAAGLAHNQSLTYIDLSSNPIGDIGAAAVGNSLQKNSVLTRLRMFHCGIESQGCVQLAAGLTQNQSLIDIDLSSNPIGDIGATAMGNSLQKNSVLKILRMTDCGIESQGCVQLAAGLVKNSSLNTLDMSENKLGVEGAKALSRLIEESTSLVDLHLGNDSLGEGGVAMLLSSQQKNTSSVSLWLSA